MLLCGASIVNSEKIPHFFLVPVLNQKRMQRVGFEQAFTKFFEIFVLQEKFLYMKKA